jgi:RNA polymerase sigma-70 factor (ECF subfamily)
MHLNIIRKQILRDKREEYFMSLYKPIHSSLGKYCIGITGNRYDSEDLMNDTVLSIYKNLDKIKNKEAFKAYAFKTARNLYKMSKRRNKFQAVYDEVEVRKMAAHIGNIERQTDFSIIYENILKFPEKTKEAMILFYISDLSNEQIREIQGGSLSGVKLRIKRGREKLIIKMRTQKGSNVNASHEKNFRHEK